MSQSTKSALRAKIRDAIYELREEKTITTSQVVGRVIQENSKLIEQEKDRLIKASLSNLAREQLRTPSTAEQLAFPLNGLISNLPPRVPTRMGPKNGPRLWVDYDHLTMQQLDARIAELRRPRGDTTQLDALMELRDLVAPLMKGKKPTATLGPAIKHLLKSSETVVA
jgi:hypothetical protein